MSQKNTPPEPFGHFKAEAFGWTDCAETDEGAQPLYDQAVMDELGERLMVSDYALKDAERQRDALLAAIEDGRKLIALISPFEGDVTRKMDRAIAEVKGGA